MTGPGRMIARFMTILAVALGSVWACTESGQILSSVDENEPSTAGASGVGPGGSTASGGSSASGGGAESMGGVPGLTLVEGPTGASVSVGAGDAHTCAIFDGALYCWGENQNGSLGLGDFESRSIPTRVFGGADFSAVGSGDGFSCAVRVGVVWCWGRGSSGQLGVGQFTSTAVPLEVTLPEPARFLDVGAEHVCVIGEGGSLYCWGQNAEGQLAQGDPWTGPGVSSAVPLQVATGQTWQKVSCGQGHTCAIRSDGALWCWGRNTRGELGLGADSAQQLREPVRVGSEVDWEEVSAGQNHTCGVRSSALYCWGDNSHSQLGILDEGVAVEGLVSEPQLVPGVETVMTVSVDTFHSCVIERDGRLLCIGRNIEGQLGDGTIDTSSVPTDARPEGEWEQISAGRFHTCGVRGGAVLCTGENVPGRLGVGDSNRRNEFTPTLQYE